MRRGYTANMQTLTKWEIFEDILGHIKLITVTTGTDEDKFNETVKKQIQQKLRNACLVNYQNKAYLRVSEDFGYDVADEFKSEGSEEESADK